MAIKQLLEKIANTGIGASTPFQLSNKVRVFNYANIVVFFISIFYTTVGLFQHYYVAVSFTIYSLASVVLSFYLVRNKKYHAAFHYTIIYSVVFLSSFSVLFGGASNAYYYLLFIPVAVNIIFDNFSVTIFYFFTSVLLMIMNVYVVNNYKPYYPVEEWMQYMAYPNIFFVGLLIFVGVRLFKQENLGYSVKIEEQNKSLEEKNGEITDSINYARRIQSALMPAEEEFISHFRESFVLFLPKDIVSGDFYWVTKKGQSVFFAVGDCTGHGVPGGFMTMLGISFLEEIVNEKNIVEPAKILDVLRERIIHALKQTGTTGESKDGMDIVLCRLDEGSLTYAAANNSLYLVRNGLASEYKPDKQPCGFYHDINPFSQHTVKTERGDILYAFSDGYADQFGGPKARLPGMAFGQGKKFKYKQLEKLVLSVFEKPLAEQKGHLENAFRAWKGNLEQVDDVCMIGVKI